MPSEPAHTMHLCGLHHRLLPVRSSRYDWPGYGRGTTFEKIKTNGRAVGLRWDRTQVCLLGEEPCLLWMKPWHSVWAEVGLRSPGPALLWPQVLLGAESRSAMTACGHPLSIQSTGGDDRSTGFLTANEKGTVHGQHPGALVCDPHVLLLWHQVLPRETWQPGEVEGSPGQDLMERLYLHPGAQILEHGSLASNHRIWDKFFCLKFIGIKSFPLKIKVSRKEAC